MKLAYYPGCSAQSTCRELGASMRKVAPLLDLDLVTLESASCTGSREIRGANRDLFLALNARILAQAGALDLPLMTVCNTCTLNLLDTRKALAEEPETRARVGDMLAELGLSYQPDVEITHFLWVLLERVGPERLRALVARPLSGLKMAAFYGCHLIRPKHHYGFSDSREARMIEDLAEILGCESIDYTGRTECCGFHTSAESEKVAVRLTGRHVQAASKGGAHAMVTPCPLCHTVLDAFQGQMSEQMKTKLDMPILHLPQLVGLALGLDPDELELSRHAVHVELPVAFPRNGNMR